MLKIAIVGNIASGKSTVEQIIQDKGYRVFDTDKIAHKILENNTEVEKHFQTCDRKELAKIVFSDSEKLKILESIIHPLVKQELKKIFAKDYEVVFVSVPQLFEAGFEKMFDRIIYITADKNVRKERLIKRNNLASDEAQKRIDAQKDIGKKENSNYVIENNSDFQNLKIAVEKVLQLIFI